MEPPKRAEHDEVVTPPTEVKIARRYRNHPVVQFDHTTHLLCGGFPLQTAKLPGLGIARAPELSHPMLGQWEVIAVRRHAPSHLAAPPPLDYLAGILDTPNGLENYIGSGTKLISDKILLKIFRFQSGSPLTYGIPSGKYPSELVADFPLRVVPWSSRTLSSSQRSHLETLNQLQGV